MSPSLHQLGLFNKLGGNSDRRNDSYAERLAQKNTPQRDTALWADCEVDANDVYAPTCPNG